MAEPLFLLFSRLYHVCVALFIPTTELPVDLRPPYQRNPSHTRERIR